MKVTLHVASVEEVAEARAAAEASLQEGDELEIVVGQPTASAPAELQPQVQAVGYQQPVRA